MYYLCQKLREHLFEDIRWETVIKDNPLGVFSSVLPEEQSPGNRAFLLPA
jgi:hypothetical protein